MERCGIGMLVMFVSVQAVFVDGTKLHMYFKYHGGVAKEYGWGYHRFLCSFPVTKRSVILYVTFLYVFAVSQRENHANKEVLRSFLLFRLFYFFPATGNVIFTVKYTVMKVI